MKRTATDLRANLYETLDYVAKTGRSVEVMRDGVELSISRKPRTAKRPKTPRVMRDLIACDPDELIHVAWPWSKGRDL